MSEQRLILPKRPKHHQHRLLAALAIGGLLVVGVWGIQMKMTFDRYAVERQNADADNAFTQAQESLRGQEQALEIRDSVDALQELVANMARRETAKNEVLDQVTEGMKAEMETGASAGTNPTPAVAGDTTEAN